MKLEVGKTYKTRSGNLVDVISSRPYYGGDEVRYLGMLKDTIPETFWYTETGRLYNSGISPLDLEKEVSNILQFNTKLSLQNGKLEAAWPKQELIENFVNCKIKITIERLNE